MMQIAAEKINTAFFCHSALDAESMPHLNPQFVLYLYTSSLRDCMKPDVTNRGCGFKCYLLLRLCQTIYYPPYTTHEYIAASAEMRPIKNRKSKIQNGKKLHPPPVESPVTTSRLHTLSFTSLSFSLSLS